MFSVFESVIVCVKHADRETPLSKQKLVLLVASYVFLLNSSVSKRWFLTWRVVRISRIYWVVRFKHVCFRRSTGHLDCQTQLGSVGPEIV